MIKDHILVWNNCLDLIRKSISSQPFKTWFEPIKPVKLAGEVITIEVPNKFFYEWLEEHYVDILRKAVKKELGYNGRLEYNILVENHRKIGGGTKEKSKDTAVPVLEEPKLINPFVIPGIKKIKIDSQLNANYTFDKFVLGDCNKFPGSAGLAIAKKPGGTAFNPLVIYGATGLGKSHLAQSIGNEVKQNFPNKTVLYTNAERFTNQFIESLKNNSVNDFVHFYQLIDVLIIDDIHFFANKAKTQDIFFHIFNHLHQESKQIILTSDRPPRDLEGVEERLLSRFKWGLSADLQAPDFETRVAILEKKMYADGIELPKDVVEFVAYNITNNVRELEGALVSLLAQASLNKKQIDLDLAKKIVKNFVKNMSREVSIDFIQKAVCDYFEVPVDKLKEKTRKRQVVQARQLSMYLSKNFTKHSLKAIGKHFGGRDHSTVIHSCQAIQNLMDTDTKFKESVDDLQKKIQMSIS